jgi:hypothetical protein
MKKFKNILYTHLKMLRKNIYFLLVLFNVIYILKIYDNYPIKIIISKNRYINEFISFFMFKLIVILAYILFVIIIIRFFTEFYAKNIRNLSCINYLDNFLSKLYKRYKKKKKEEDLYYYIIKIEKPPYFNKKFFDDNFKLKLIKDLIDKQK